MTGHSEKDKSGLTDDQREDLMGDSRRFLVEGIGGKLERELFPEGLFGNLLSEYREKKEAERWQIFKDEEHRKQLYFANKDCLIKEGIERKEPGFRPWAFWEYETEIEATEHTKLQHEYLIKNKLLLNGELDGIIEAWLQEFETFKPNLQYSYKIYKERGRRYSVQNGSVVKEWPEDADMWGKEAELYGGRALKAWKSLLAEAESGGHEPTSSIT